MEKMPVKQNHEYTVTCDGECNIYDFDTQVLLHTHKEGEAQSHFTAIGMAVEYDNADAKLTLVFNAAPGGSSNGGGNVNSDLNIGHPAADAVAAVCTLTLGDLGTGGTLTDSNGQSVELDAPHAYATGWVGIADATAAGGIKFGEHEAIEFAAKAAAKAGGYFVCAYDNYEIGGTLKLVRGEDVLFEHEFLPPQGEGWTLEGIKADLESDPAWECEILDEDSEVDFLAPVVGAGWNDVELVLEGELFLNGAVYHGGMSGGSDARTPQEVVDALNASADCPAVAVMDEDEQGITLTAKEYGVDYELSEDGSLFSNPQGMGGGHGDYSVAELVTAIGGEFDDISAAAGEEENTITLTAGTTGAAANAIVYTTTGCFGGETVKQGSTTRGKDAVAQTDYEIVLNGNQPRQLTPTTAMKNGGVYTVAADIDASLITLPANATAEIWVRIGAAAFNVSLPDTWVWVNGAASDMTGKTNTTFCIAVRNDGVKVLASMAYSYETTPAQS